MDEQQANKSTADSVLRTDSLTAGYGGAPIVENICITVGAGEIFAVLGANGSGKSTFVKTIIGELKPTRGSVDVLGRDVTGWAQDKLTKLGVGYVPQIDDSFRTMTVRENLEMGGYLLSKRQLRERMAAAVDLFPNLARIIGRKVDVLSGGERKMVGIARALMISPRLVLFDEPTAGLATQIARQVLEHAVSVVAGSGAGVLLVEQRAEEVLRVAHRAAVFANGSVYAQGPVAELMNATDLGKIFLGSKADGAG